MIASSAGGTAGLSSEGGGGVSVMTRIATSISVPPPNADRAGRAFVEGDAEREDVRACIDVPSAQLLGRHESRRANRASLHRQTFHRLCISQIVLRDFASPKSSTFSCPARRDDDVVRLDVTMNDAGGVGRLQRLRRLDADVHDFGGR